MRDRWKLAVPALLMLGLAGCAAEKYQPAPLVPARTATELESRNLEDPGLRQYMERTLGHPLAAWPLESWDLQTLTLAALYFNPQIQVARAGAEVAQAGEITAGERPNPSLSLTPGIPSPWLFDMPLVFPIETHGKRQLRIEEARNLTSAAQMAVGEAAWNVASGLRRALLTYEMAERNLALAQATEKLENEQVALLGRMFSMGEGARPAVETARLALANARFAIRADQVQLATGQAALAAAIGVPVTALTGVQIDWPDLERLPSLASLSPAQIQRDAVLNRLDVRRALQEYAAADAGLRLQIAEQYPNFNIGPGYAFEESNNYFTAPFSIVLPIRNHNQGPIAQAEAFRKEAATNFLAVQERAIAQSQQALATYRTALAELEEADHPLEDQRRRVEMARSALTAGEADQQQVNSLQLENVVYARQHMTALGQAQAAFGALEDAVEKPLDPDATFSPVLAPISALPGRKESKQ